MKKDKQAIEKLGSVHPQLGVESSRLCENVTPCGEEKNLNTNRRDRKGAIATKKLTKVLNLSEQANKLLISFSGGETSGYMTYKLIEQFRGWKEIIVVFANTGEENEQTLEFVDKCDKHFGLNVVWVEAQMNMKHGKGASAKVVTFETASRNGEPFEAMIAKHGIPNVTFKHCSRVLKREAIRAYARSIGWKKKTEYKTAIGFRGDEMDKCIASPRYFYNKYWKIYDKDGNEIPKKELTEEEWNERTMLLEKMRNTPIRRRNLDRPLLPDDCFEKLPSFLKVGGQKKLKEKND